MLEMGQEFSLEFSLADRFRALVKLPAPMRDLFIDLLPNVECMYVRMFVCYKKGSVSFDPNNPKFTQKIKDQGLHGTGNKFYLTENGAEFAEKSLKMGSVAMKTAFRLQATSRQPASSPGILLVLITIIKMILIILIIMIRHTQIFFPL